MISTILFVMLGVPSFLLALSSGFLSVGQIFWTLWTAAASYIALKAEELGDE